HDVPPAADAAVGADRQPLPQVVLDQHLLRLRQAQLPGRARALDGGEWGGAGPAAVPADQHVVGPGLGDAGGDGAHPRLADQLDPDARVGVDGLQVVDQLGEVLDRVDV